MRTKHSVRFLIISALTFAGFVIVGQLFGVFGSSATDKAEAEQSKALLKEIGKYRKWKLVNPTPVVMNPGAAAACAIAFPVNPHESAWASVYVNAKGASAMMTEGHPAFPEGSMIVKEKLYTSVGKDPVVLTVMIKREKGYTPESRDWEYLVLDGPATKIVERGKLSKCNECHEKYDDTDFVTMHYLNPRPGIQ
jgi:cytochrome c556